MKRKEKTLKQQQLAIADALAGAACRSRGKCQMSGLDNVTCKGNLSWCHIVEKVQPYVMRWDPMNCLAMCSGHHVFYTFRHARWMLQIEKNFPENWAYIRTNINEVFDGDYERIIEELKEQI